MALPQPQPHAEARPARRYTIEEYLQIAQATDDVRYEYYDGEIVAMAGASSKHSAIERNIIGQFYGQLRGKPCQVFTSSLAVALATSRHFVQPDVSVVCGEVAYDGRVPNAITNPSVVFEVTSPSTEKHDRTTKLQLYRGLPSLSDYFIVSQEAVWMDHYQRHEEGWLHTSYLHRSTTIDLVSLGCTLALTDIYEGLDVEDSL